MITTKYYESPDAWFDANGIDDYDYTEFNYIDGHLAECYRYERNEVWFIQEVQGWRLASDIELDVLINGGKLI